MIKGTLLIVDDNKSVISALEMMLQYEVEKVIASALQREFMRYWNRMK